MAKTYGICCRKEQKPLKSPRSGEKPNYFAKFGLDSVVFHEITVINRQKVLEIAKNGGNGNYCFLEQKRSMNWVRRSSDQYQPL